MDQKSQSPLYKRAAWQRRRKAQLKKQSICQHCWDFQRKVTVATVCDHIQPWTTRQEFFENAVQSLCEECHNIKTRTEDVDFHKRKSLLKLEEFDTC